MDRPAHRILRRLGSTATVATALLAVLLAAGIISGNHLAVDVVAAGAHRLGIGLESRLVSTNGTHLYVVLAGPQNGPPVVLLHGFPEFWWGWNQQIAALANAGFRVVAPDQRGYDLSDKPDGVEAYRLALLERDIVGLIENLGYTSVYLAGHDWGGVVAWRVAIDYPEHVRKLVIFNMGH